MMKKEAIDEHKQNLGLFFACDVTPSRHGRQYINNNTYSNLIINPNKIIKPDNQNESQDDLQQYKHMKEIADGLYQKYSSPDMDDIHTACTKAVKVDLVSVKNVSYD